MAAAAQRGALVVVVIEPGFIADGIEQVVHHLLDRFPGRPVLDAVDELAELEQRFQLAGLDAVREAFFDQAAKRWRLIVPDFGVLEGAFLVAALEYAGEHEGEASFALSLASAGEVTFSAL